MSGNAEPRPSSDMTATGAAPGSRVRSLILFGFGLAAAWTLIGIVAPGDGAAASERHPAVLGSLLGDVGDGLTDVVDATTDVVDATVGGAVAVVDAAAPVAAPVTHVVVEQVAAPLTAAVDRTTGTAVGAVVDTTAPVVDVVDEVVRELPALPSLPSAPAIPVPELPEGPGVEGPAPTTPDVDLLPDLDRSPSLDLADETSRGASPGAVLPASIVGGVGVAVAAEPSASAGPDETAETTASTPSSAVAAVLRGSTDDPAARGPLAGDPVAVTSATSATAVVAVGAATLDASSAPHLDSDRTAPPRDDPLPTGPFSDSAPSPD